MYNKYLEQNSQQYYCMYSQITLALIDTFTCMIQVYCLIHNYYKVQEAYCLYTIYIVDQLLGDLRKEVASKMCLPLLKQY